MQSHSLYVSQRRTRLFAIIAIAIGVGSESGDCVKEEEIIVGATTKLLLVDNECMDGTSRLCLYHSVDDDLVPVGSSSVLTVIQIIVVNNVTRLTSLYD